jgi:hypothetical protein
LIFSKNMTQTTPTADGKYLVRTTKLTRDLADQLIINTSTGHAVPDRARGHTTPEGMVIHTVLGRYLVQIARYDQESKESPVPWDSLDQDLQGRLRFTAQELARRGWNTYTESLNRD